LRIYIVSTGFADKVLWIGQIQTVRFKGVLNNSHCLPAHDLAPFSQTFRERFDRHAPNHPISLMEKEKRWYRMGKEMGIEGALIGYDDSVDRKGREREYVGMYVLSYCVH